MRDAGKSARQSKLNQKTTAISNLEIQFFNRRVNRNILKTFRRTVVLTNRLLGRSRPLARSRRKGSGEKGRRFLSVQGLDLFYTAKRIAQGGNAQIFCKNIFIVAPSTVCACRPGIERCSFRYFSPRRRFFRKFFSR